MQYNDKQHTSRQEHHLAHNCNKGWEKQAKNSYNTFSETTFLEIFLYRYQSVTSTNAHWTVSLDIKNLNLIMGEGT